MGKATRSPGESDYGSSGSPIGVADKSPGKAESRRMSDVEQAGRESDKPYSGAKRSFFEVYKPGQGYYTRMCTAIGAGILVLGAGNFLWQRLEVFRSDAPWTLWLQVLVPAVVVVGLGLATFYFVAVHRGACDFLIATEGEMKKVSWSTRNELIGSTKVVIAVTIIMGAGLFLVDAVFIKFFQLIGVLRSGS